LKAFVGVSVFGKEEMLHWMLTGIQSSFPPGTVVHFYFEACKDKSEENFLKHVDSVLGSEYPWSYSGSPDHILEHGAHRLLISKFMETDCDYIVIPHDDNRFLSNQIPKQIETVIETYTESLGWISCRDGYDFGYRDMISSQFSSSDKARAKLDHGQWAERTMMNTGPVIYTRKLINKVGLPDPDMAWYWWDEYALRCHHAGLKNILLGMDCAHYKFGQIQNNHALFDGALVAKDLAHLRDKWRPILGFNPL
jgi:hypothetical protein